MGRRKHSGTGHGIFSGWWSALRKSVVRTLTRGPALLRRMGIPMNETPLERRGLIIVQIDGLSHNRLQRALREGKMRHLRKLLRRRKFKTYRYLSEIPTSTPAFQAGMFYGDNSNIPGFHFYDKQEQRAYYMGHSDCAYAIEQGFRNPGLLKGGSVFSCVYSGGAEASLFIFSSLTAPQRWRFALRLWDLLLLTAINLTVLFNMLALAVMELGSGLLDFVRRVCRYGRVAHELEQLAVRVGLSVIGRELITLGAVIDIHRHVPVIYVNFLGYDEHAHLRGPDSRFARWSLRAIDRCIRRIFLASLASEREYDLYVLSDHGQCATKPFEELAGETLADLLRRETSMSVSAHGLRDSGNSDALQSASAMMRVAQSMPRPLKQVLTRYAEYLRRSTLEKMNPETLAHLDLTVLSTGPIAYVYWTRIKRALTVSDVQRAHPALLERLTNHPAIGFISLRLEEEGEADVLVLSRRGRMWLGADGVVRREGILPFDSSISPAHVISGVRRITLAPRAGDICVWGGGSDFGDVTFAPGEYGSHSGWTDEEIEAFVIAPSTVDFDFSVIRRHNDFYRFFARHYCGTSAEEPQEEKVVPDRNPPENFSAVGQRARRVA